MFGFLGVAFKYLIAGAVGFLIGVIITVILLTKKNFEMYQKITKEVEDRYESGKGLYNAMVYGGSSDGSNEEETEENDEDEDDLQDGD